jgi:N-acetylneuraminic acid mutarotase
MLTMKKIFLFVLLLNVISVYSDYTFLTPPFTPVMSSGAPIPVGFRYPSAAGYTRNDTGWIYTFGGLQDGNIISSAVYRYNINTDTWNLETNLPDGGFWISAAARIGNMLYNIGGTYTTALNQCLPRVKIYDVISGTWSSGTPMIYGRCFHAVTAYQDSLIYCAGGWGYPGGVTYGDVYLYNAISDQWRTATNMPAPRSGGVLAVCNDTLVYVCGGPEWYNPSALSTIFRGVVSQSDRSVITWDSSGQVYPGGVRNSIYGASWGSKGVIVSGGYQVSQATNQVYVYSSGRNQWTQQPNMTITRTDHGSASVNIGNVWKFVMVSGTSTRTVTTTSVNILTDTIFFVPVKHEQEIIPESYSLHQNYPNPFNPVTVIIYEVPYESRINIAVYNSLGILIETLFDGNSKPGTYSVNFFSEKYSSGIYFCRLISGNVNKTIKMILVK